MIVHEIKGWAVLFLPDRKLAIEGGKTPLPWVRRTKREAAEFAKSLAEHGVEGGKPVRVSVFVEYQTP